MTPRELVNKLFALPEVMLEKVPLAQRPPRRCALVVRCAFERGTFSVAMIVSSADLAADVVERCFVRSPSRARRARGSARISAPRSLDS